MTIPKSKKKWGTRFVSDKSLGKKEKKKETVAEFLKRGGKIEKLDYEDEYLEDARNLYYHSNSSILNQLTR